MDAPKYDVGNVIDLRFSRDTMPDRIYINMVYKKVGSTEWIYEALSEKNNRVIVLPESQISNLESKKESKCYEHELIQRMYRDGFRFCGNNKSETARIRALNMVDARYIKHIILCDAIGTDGNPIDGYLGLWVQYNTVINNDEHHEANNGRVHYIK